MSSSGSNTSGAHARPSLVRRDGWCRGNRICLILATPFAPVAPIVAAAAVAVSAVIAAVSAVIAAVAVSAVIAAVAVSAVIAAVAVSAVIAAVIAFPFAIGVGLLCLSRCLVIFRIFSVLCF